MEAAAGGWLEQSAQSGSGCEIMQDGCDSCREVECVSRAEACQQWADRRILELYRAHSSGNESILTYCVVLTV